MKDTKVLHRFLEILENYKQNLGQKKVTQSYKGEPIKKGKQFKVGGGVIDPICFNISIKIKCIFPKN